MSSEDNMIEFISATVKLVKDVKRVNAQVRERDLKKSKSAFGRADEKDEEKQPRGRERE
jgi:hypothetical protein